MTDATVAPAVAGDAAVGQVAAPSRHARRRERTRAALVEAATELLVTEGPDVPIQAITNRADVGLGSFYNHFRDKQDIFRAVAEEALATFERDTVARAAVLADPLERVAAALRLYGRISETHPQLAPVIIGEGELALQTRQAHVDLFDRVLAGLGVAGASELFDAPDMSLRTSFMISSLRLVMRLRTTDAGFDAAETDVAAGLLLELLGVDPATARDLCSRPLPPPPPEP